MNVTNTKNPDWFVRPYAAPDREPVRRLAVATAEVGDPSPGLFGDRELLADWLTDYYLDREPASCFVAEAEGFPVGYVTGCLDTAAYLKAMGRVSLRALAGALGRGLILRPDFWRALPRATAAACRARSYRAPATLERRPAHLHLNIAPSHRGRGIGRALIDAFQSRARAAGVAGVHLGTRADNPFRLFFERVGFHEEGRGRLPSWNTRGPILHDVVLYAKDLR